jgi:hypothetical protein
VLLPPLVHCNGSHVLTHPNAHGHNTTRGQHTHT